MGYGIIIIVVIGMLVAGPLICIANGMAVKAENNQHNEYLDKHGVVVAKEYEYSNAMHSKHIRVVIDERNKNLYISNRYGYFDKIPFSDVLGAEICADNRVLDNFGNVLAGGIIAGTAGAIAGATSSTPAVRTYKVLVYTKQISTPKISINLIDTTTEKDSIDYTSAVRFAENVFATIKAIVYLSTTNNTL